MKTLFLILFSLLLIPLMSVATAELPELNVMAFVQIIQRDDNGSLIGYLEYNDAHIMNIEVFDALMKFGGESKIIERNGIRMELKTFDTKVSTDASGLMSTVNLGLTGDDRKHYIAVAVAHDGMRVPQPEEVTVIWNFLRPV